MLTKPVLREQLKQRHANIRCSDESSHAVRNNLICYLEPYFQNQIRVLSYRALKSWGEIDLDMLLEEATNWDITYALVELAQSLPGGDFDIVFVPLYGFSSSGYRLGHGGAWYDRFLVTQPNALKIGIGFEDFRVDFKHEVHDVRMDVIITEKQTYYFN